MADAEKLDNNAYWKEKKIKCNNNGSINTEDISELDNCYLSSIKAKLAIL